MDRPLPLCLPDSRKPASRLAVVTALVLFGATRPTDAQVQDRAWCHVLMQATGIYKAEVRTNAPLEGAVEYKLSTDPSVKVAIETGGRLCDRYPISGERTPQPLPGPAAYDISSHDSGTLDDRFHHVLMALHEATQRNVGDDRVSRNDFYRLVDAQVKQDFFKEARKIAADTAMALVAKGLNPSKLVDNDGAKWVVDLAVKMMIDHYLRGNDPEQIIDGLLSDMVGHLQSQAGRAVKAAAGDELEAVLKPYLEELARLVKSKLVKVKPDVQTSFAEAESDNCTWTLSTQWDPKSGKYSALFDKYCGDPLQPVTSVTVPSVEPGDADVEITARGMGARGPLALRSATVTGLAAVTGAGEPPADIRGDRKTAKFQFDVKKPLADTNRDVQYRLQITLRTDEGRTGIWRGTITVKNVPPRITDLSVTETDADPGETMKLDNVRLTVVDDNAESPNEVPVANLELGPHPAGLRTHDPFDDFDDPKLQDFEPDTGTLVFLVQRDAGEVETPHAHREFWTTLTVRDDNDKKASRSLTLRVNDVPPRFEHLKVQPAFVHHVAGLVSVSGRLVDDNGVIDLDRPRLTVEPGRAAAGNVAPLTLARGLNLDSEGEDFLEFSGSFEHTKLSGVFDIDFEASDRGGVAHEDGPHEIRGVKELSVGNEAPVIAPWGFVYNSELPEPVPDQTGKGLCAGQPFVAGAIVNDFEGDPLTARATIVETGARVALIRADGERTYKGTLRAPERPGNDYHLRFDALELPPYLAAARPRTSDLRVIACEEDGADYGLQSIVEPRRTLCPGQHFNVQGFEVVYEPDEPPVRVYWPGTITFEGESQNVDDARRRANFNAPLETGPYPIDIVLDVDGVRRSLGDHILVVPCDLEEKDRYIEEEVDILQHPEYFDPFEGARDPDVQLMMMDVGVLPPLPPLESVIVGDGATAPKPNPFAWIWDAFRNAARNRLHVEPRPSLFEPPRASRQTRPRLPAAPGQPQVRAYLTSLGNSSGEAFQLHLLNGGNVPLQLEGNGIVVEPLKKKAAELAREKLQEILDKNPLQLKIDAYCLEFLRRPPTKDMMFQLADAQLQEQFAPARRILAASRELFDGGALTPDMDPEAYFHSIRQWSVWTHEQGFDMESFEKAFLKITRENVETANRSWNEKIEEAVRALVPNRWRDIESVLHQAQR